VPACGVGEAVYERNDTRTRLDRPVARPDVKELEAIAQELRVTIEDQFVESGQYDEIMASCGLTAEHIVAAAALRWRAGADVALCHTATIMRSGLPAGDIDVNDLSVI
jgi:hypothetical protein